MNCTFLSRVHKHPREDNPDLYYWDDITGPHTFNITDTKPINDHCPRDHYELDNLNKTILVVTSTSTLTSYVTKNDVIKIAVFPGIKLKFLLSPGKNFASNRRNYF